MERRCCFESCKKRSAENKERDKNWGNFLNDLGGRWEVYPYLNHLTRHQYLDEQDYESSSNQDLTPMRFNSVQLTKQ